MAGKLTGAKIQTRATLGLPSAKVAKVQRTFTVSTLSMGGIDAAAKLAGRQKLEGAVARSLRKLRAKEERKELARLLTQLDVRIKDCCGRLIEVAMRGLIGQLRCIQAMQADELHPIGHVSAAARERVLPPPHLSHSASHGMPPLGTPCTGPHR